MLSGLFTREVYLVAVLGLMAVSLLTISGIIRSYAVLGAAIVLTFVIVSFRLVAQYRVLRE